jgi:hypothetical protein
VSVRVAMFSGPRNISTTMMRAFENRPDTAVVDEPFYAAWLARSGADHPYREETLASLPHSHEAVLRWLGEPPARFGKPGATMLFEKHIAFHFDDAAPLDWLLERQVFLLIRDPRAMVASYAKKLGEIEPIVRSFAMERRILDWLAARGRPCPVVDSADVLADPEGMLRALCDALAIPFTERMLSWPAGPRLSDGVWAPHWYDAVNASTGFRREAAKEISLSAELESVAATCAEDYAELHRRRLRPPA